MNDGSHADLVRLRQQIDAWASELGFQQVGISDTGLDAAEQRLDEWLARGLHGDMAYMQRHGRKRSRPADLVPGTVRVICARMNYLPQSQDDAKALLECRSRGYVSRYALGRDYHKVLRRRLQSLADRIQTAVGEFGYRVFVDSAPVLEKPLAENAGLGWIGKHTNLIHDKTGSWFFLGEIYTDLPLPTDQPASAHCGSCTACIDVCPTGAIIAPWVLDARRCISYLTIELAGSIPEELREPMGNRIYGCDDCQLFCPWNKFATVTAEADFQPRHGLDGPELVDLFGWTEADWLARTEGSAIRRIGYERWLRNVAIALGNAPSSPEIVRALKLRRQDCSPLVAEHIDWALARHQ